MQTDARRCDHCGHRRDHHDERGCTMGMCSCDRPGYVPACRRCGQDAAWMAQLPAESIPLCEAHRDVYRVLGPALRKVA